MYALNTAYREFGFTHYDLHGENILFRKIDNYDEFYIPYGGDFIFAEGIVTIIDYGRSYIKIPETNESIGYKPSDGYKSNVQSAKYGTYIDQSHPLGDCYRFVSSTLHYMKPRNKDVYEKVKGLLYYFFSI